MESINETIHPDTDLGKDGLHLNKHGTIAFAKNASSYLLELNRLSSENSRNKILETQQTSCKIAKNFIGKPLHNNLIDVEFKRNINIIRAISIKSTKYSENIRLKNLNRLIF